MMVTSERAGLKANSDNTKMMNIKSTQVGEVRIGQNLLEEEEGFQYLGSINNTTGGMHKDIIARISEARRVFAMMKPLWRSSSLLWKTKLRIFKCNVKSVPLYRAETWLNL